MKQVTKDEFFAVIDMLDVHPRIIGNYPYTSDWETQTPQRRVVGRTVDRYETPGVRWPVVRDYFLSEESR